MNTICLKCCISHLAKIQGCFWILCRSQSSIRITPVSTIRIFAFCHPLFTDQMKIYSDVTVSRLLSTVSCDQIITFLDDWNAGRDKKQRIYVSYDSTNKNCQAGDIDLVEFGKAKDDKANYSFNVSIAFDKTNRVPLFFTKSIRDPSQMFLQFRCMVDKVIEYGYKKIGFILDRGYFSKENIQYMDETSTHSSSWPRDANLL